MILVAFLALAGVGILVQMVRIQFSEQAQTFLLQGDRYSGEFQTIYPERGEIFDRDGHLLAGNRTVYEVGVSLKEVKDAHALAYALSMYLGLSQDDVYNKLVNSPQTWEYVVIQDYVGADTVNSLQEQLKQMFDSGDDRLSGLAFKPHFQRSYPEDTLASNLLGFVTRDGRGYFGIEEKYNDLLAGNPVQVWVPGDPNKAMEIPKVPNGTTLVLTINRDLQARVEEILDQSLTKYGAENGTVIVMDPHNGEILAMASSPRMDLNNYSNYFSLYDDGSQYNRSIGMSYEPGSVFKVLTMAAALDTGTVRPETTFVDTGAIDVGGITIRNWNRDSWGEQTMTGCLQHSLNVCLAWVATQIGMQNFYTYMERFGIGHSTGIDLSGEAAGRLKVPGDTDWYPVDLGTNAFGQGIAVTPLQMTSAYAAIGGGGILPHPYLVEKIDGKRVKNPAGRRVVSKGTAERMMSMFRSVVLEGTGSEAAIPGYTVAGKTGTAQKAENGVYVKKYVASFVGLVPAKKPRLAILVMVDEPHGNIYGGSVAAPIFRDIARFSLQYLEVPPDAPETKGA
jgi:cell division protein FtsI/penicillin-binding protein 2